MAGLGEACSHIAALLFAAETYNRLNKDVSCTSLPCAWLPPSVKYAPISDINFTAPPTKRKKLSMVNLLASHENKFQCRLLKKKSHVSSMIYQKQGNLHCYPLSRSILMLSKEWFRYRTGRVTSSRFKAAAHTCHNPPSHY